MPRDRKQKARARGIRRLKDNRGGPLRCHGGPRGAVEHQSGRSGTGRGGPGPGRPMVGEKEAGQR
ncbi:hypothetical protein E2C01_040397 [Portunus trituberculatus]|uniref:Uncharacterized protein n=1 Tax=Portunus trituberculatus TaxID=210409 RepID=A0A5B7FJL2_PORTR|nr:hypothetical protein [Portunus trituberculatus]